MPISPPMHQPARAKTKQHRPRVENRQATRQYNTGSKAWARIRQRILLRDGYTCRVCGRYGDQVDHIDGDSHNNADSNLQTMCISDHSAKTMREVNANRG